MRGSSLALLGGAIATSARSRSLRLLGMPSRAKEQRINRSIPVALIGAALTIAASLPRAAAPDAPPAVPLVVGLITSSAVHDPGNGDYESIMRVSAVTASDVTFTVSANVEDRRISVRRRESRTDMEASHVWRPRYHEGDPEMYAGSTGLGLSSALLADVKTKPRASLTVFLEDDDPLDALTRGLGSALSTALGGGDHVGAKGTVSRVEAQPVPVSVLLNDVRVDLPTIHARGKIGDDDGEFYILDNPTMPLVLRFRLGATSSRIVKIIVPSEAATRDLESRLSNNGRAEIYGIYFDFGKATIRPESEAVLKEIADVMAKNPSWVLQVEGHTDNIGRAQANQDLSVRRSTAVGQALVARYHIAPARLTSQGFGASRPKETNDTIEGRARNRRVELVRQSGP